MTDIFKKAMVLAIELMAFIAFYCISVVMIISVFTIAVLNIPDEAFSGFPSVRSAMVAMLLIAGPQLILAQSIAWWYSQYQRWIGGLPNGPKSD